MIKLVINFFFLLFFLSCQNESPIKFPKKINYNNDNDAILVNTNLNVLDNIHYVLGETYFIQGVEYTPQENYSYSEIGLGSFYGKELHKTKTINNDLNDVTELLGRHKTLPIPSIVKVTNLDNGLYITLKINDRHNDNSALIQVSRKAAQLLKFYKSGIAKVKVEIMSDPSKQMKVVSQSIGESSFNNTIDSAPTEVVSIFNLEDESKKNIKSNNFEQPIEIGYNESLNKDLYLKIYNFKSYEEAKSIVIELEITNKFVTQKDLNTYSMIIGPLKNTEANKLVLSFISKGYKETEFILE